jgi:hypothetical protein
VFRVARLGAWSVMSPKLTHVCPFVYSLHAMHYQCSPAQRNLQ